MIEETLLRIAQESVTNTVKHSGATFVKIVMAFSPENVVLEIKDNGKGFTPQNCAGPEEGHFGLLGMAERAKRLGGQISVTSAVGAGATVHVEIPIMRPEILPSADEQTEHEESIADSNSHC